MNWPWGPSCPRGLISQGMTGMPNKTQLLINPSFLREVVYFLTVFMITLHLEVNISFPIRMG